MTDDSTQLSELEERYLKNDEAIVNDFINELILLNYSKFKDAPPTYEIKDRLKENERLFNEMREKSYKAGWNAAIQKMVQTLKEMR